MTEVPNYIRLIKFKSKNKLILNTLKEYFDMLPCITNTKYGLNDGYTYYILPSTITILHIIDAMRECLDNIDISIFSTAVYAYMNKKTKTKHLYEINPNAWDYAVLPPRVKIDSNDAEKLKIFPED